MAIQLQAEPREIIGKHVKTLRRAGLVPAEIYGKGLENISIQVPEKALRRTLREAGATTLIDIKLGKKKAVSTLARNIQYEPISRQILHVDFYAVNMAETVTVSVPIKIVGSTELIDTEHGMLISGIDEVEIEALPANLPEAIEVDISVLENFSDSISVADLVLDEGLTVHSSPESMLATIQPPRVEEVFTDETESIVDEGEASEAGEASEEGEE